MSKLEKYSLIFFGFFAFLVVFLRIGFVLGISVTSFSLILAFGLYVLGLAIIFRYSIVTPVLVFIITGLSLLLISIPLSYTYDTSWDGQGYHQTAVIALTNGWNPIKTSQISFDQELPSQIFAEGYPSAVWEIESTIYSLIGKVNAAKVVNIAIALISTSVVYILLRKLNFNSLLSSIISLLVVMQPLYMIQLLTFMQDGFGYQLVVIAVASLVVFIMDKKSYWAIGMFILAEIFLVSAKYSFLPLALILGFIFGVNLVNRYLNKEYLLNRKTNLFIVGLAAFALIFAWVPYIRNATFHHSPFFPTNEPDLIGSVRYNNVPHNIADKDKLTLFFYGIFSKSQSQESGDTRSPQNLAFLKFPFTFSLQEISDSAELFNNRVGASGPLFSGIVILCLAFLLFLSFKATTQTQKYIIYGSFFALSMIVVSAITVPTPNLIRYVSQIQLIPFIVIIAAYAAFKLPYIKPVIVFLVILIGINNLLYAASVVTNTAQKTKAMNDQFEDMRDSGIAYKVRSQHFYSNYVLLKEQKIDFVIANNLNCENSEALVASSTTTRYCAR